jgi:glycerol-3-phosphate acyltransferase PlsY
MISALAAGPITALLLGRAPESDAALIAALVGGAIVVLKHADNLQRLLTGSERRLGHKPAT